MKIVGLTGGIACGKSAVSKQLSRAGLSIIDADVIAHEILAPGSATYKKVVAKFGRSILKDECIEGESSIDRKKLGSIVFSDESARRNLADIMNWSIGLEIARQLAWHFIVGTSVVVMDVPLLFETKMDSLCHFVVVVVTSPETQLDRLMKRDGAGEDDARARVAAQKMTAADKAKRADLVIDNSKDLSELGDAVLKALPRILRRNFRHSMLSCPSVLLVLASAMAAATFFGFVMLVISRSDIYPTLNPEL
jgi:dephospho-CoA kinase